MSSPAKLYVYDTVSGTELSKTLFQLGFSTKAGRLNKRKICRLTGIDVGQLNRWINGQRDVPLWFLLIVAHWQRHGFDLTKDVAAAMIREDVRRPGKLYPFRGRLAELDRSDSDELEEAAA